MLAWFVAAALGGTPPAGLEPVAAPADAPKQYAAWASKRGAKGGLVCEPVFPDEVLLCFRLRQDGKRRWVTDADLAAWDCTLEDLRNHVMLRRGPHAQVEKRPIEGMSAHYWTVRNGAGWAVTALVRPDDMAETSGGPVVAAMPTEGIVLWWLRGDAEVDKVMAVAVAELYGKDGVSKVVHRHNGVRWMPFAEASRD